MMKRHVNYLWYVVRHKWYVMLECFKRGQFLLGILHDWSKFLPSEFFPYAKHFYNTDGTRVAKRRNKTGYYKPTNTGDKPFDRAWFYHQKRNKHHWQWWILVTDACSENTKGVGKCDNINIDLGQNFAKNVGLSDHSKISPIQQASTDPYAKSIGMSTAKSRGAKGSRLENSRNTTRNDIGKTQKVIGKELESKPSNSELKSLPTMEKDANVVARSRWSSFVLTILGAVGINIESGLVRAQKCTAGLNKANIHESFESCATTATQPSPFMDTALMGICKNCGGPIPQLRILPMPMKYRIEMICDWFGASRAQKTTGSVKNWWDKNGHKMQLHPSVRKWVEANL